MINWVLEVSDYFASFARGSTTQLIVFFLLSTFLFVLILLIVVYLVSKLFAFLHFIATGHKFLFGLNHANAISLIFALGLGVDFIVILDAAIRTGKFEYSTPRHASEVVIWTEGHTYFICMIVLQAGQLFGSWASLTVALKWLVSAELNRLKQRIDTQG